LVWCRLPHSARRKQGQQCRVAFGWLGFQVHIGRYDGVNVDGAAQPHFSWTGLDQPPALAAAFQVKEAATPNTHAKPTQKSLKATCFRAKGTVSSN
jgi:hypothetical protein